MRLIHLSDPHLTTPPHWRSLFGRSHFGKRFLGYGSWSRRRRFSLRRAWLDELQVEVRSRQPDRILLSGDLTQTGTLEEIRQARDWLGQLAPAEQLSLVPGNHDVYAADSWPNLAREWQPYLPAAGSDGFPFAHRAERVAVFGLCSAVPTRPGSACGLLGTAQLERLAEMLAEQADAFRLLLLHHPPLPGMIRFRKRLRDAAGLERVLRAHPVDMVLYGHRHRNVSAGYPGTRTFCTAPASAEAGAFRQITIEQVDAGWQVEQELVQRAGEGRFEVAERLSWAVSGRA